MTYFKISDDIFLINRYKYDFKQIMHCQSDKKYNIIIFFIMDKESSCYIIIYIIQKKY